MELEEFKAHWKAVQQEDIKQQEHTPEALNQIIKNTTNTMGELQEKSSYWRTIGSWNSGLMLLLVIGYCSMLYYRGEAVQTIIEKLPLLAVIVVFALFSNWVYKRQEDIFSATTNESLKEGIRNTLLSFKRYYRFTNSVFLLLAPVAFYAVFELFLTGLALPLSSIIFISFALTGLSFLLRYVYYRTIYFSRIKAMETNLRELENAH
ncbi:hypothetical protein MKJ04_14495 [Pontibacter sp. E15-1]|uniref:hypothetical protein n=1 Tax=Pontibacter sp. E15-1 TaxID=2919918 RepID=UPI001F4FFBD7|nr:hypothetical protein [Pontibacter sp. E15-1]MCJ8166053.1 hypothetical protein [Pontibacter sp. E15-1]